MKKRSLLDSFAVLAMLKKEAGHRRVVGLLQEAREGKVEVLMNQINVGEVYYQTVKQRLTDDVDRFMETLLTLPIIILGNDLTLTFSAARIKARYAISYADCFAVATAISEKASILTGDPEFRQVEHMVRVEWM